MNNTIRSVLSIAFASASAFVSAGYSEGTVTYPLAHPGDVFMFSAGDHKNAPASGCLKQSLGTWAVKTNTATGKSMQAIVLTAYAMGKTVRVEGKGSCTDWGDRETPLYLYIVD